MITPSPAVAERIDARRADLTARIVQRHFDANPDRLRLWGAQGRQRCTEDAEFHLTYLAEAVRAGSIALFSEYIGWVRDLLESRRIAASDLEANLDVLEAVVREALADADLEVIAPYLDAGRAQTRSEQTPASTSPLSPVAREYLLALLEGNRATAESLVEAELARGVALRDLYLHVFQAVQLEIGRLWQRNQISVAQEHLCTAATERIMARVIARHPAQAPARRSIVVASVASEQHAMGARILADFFEMDGWDVHYLGANTPAVSIVEIARDRQAAVLAISATMAYHIPHVRDLIIRVRARRDLSHLRVLVGGRPFNIEPELWRRVGADGYAADAPSAIAEAGRLTGLRPRKDS